MCVCVCLCVCVHVAVCMYGVVMYGLMGCGSGCGECMNGVTSFSIHTHTHTHITTVVSMFYNIYSLNCTLESIG